MTAPTVAVNMPEFNDDIVTLYFCRGEESCCEVCGEQKTAGLLDDDMVFECTDCFIKEVANGFYKLLDAKP